MKCIIHHILAKPEVDAVYVQAGFSICADELCGEIAAAPNLYGEIARAIIEAE